MKCKKHCSFLVNPSEKVCSPQTFQLARTKLNTLSALEQNHEESIDDYILLMQALSHDSEPSLVLNLAAASCRGFELYEFSTPCRYFSRKTPK